ncbi:excinuclease ABC subunit UvrC [Kangiella koreensis]|uniref:UvrABC system protein C n=1 Tax=Kangiella koreensis (strain DSM 16069 / JCM 12317 / KCTC 12182 / SW-125) TaxID=523791 RepID=C7RAS4_KANKD|nr:excinuclease ABC subunit UvrC [Kangiella koreensis]ACV26366.1 excinuclease ABC, C subunit [Kangiella koreensis DSM 16069]
MSPADDNLPSTKPQIKKILAHLSHKPGVYQMLGKDGETLYVGKAKNLSNRVKSYFTRQYQSPKTELLVTYIEDIHTTVTETETEALLLENNLIKKYKPRFNVLFRDDKSYPYVFLSAGDFPRLAYHRGAKKEKGDYFGPFPSSSAVRQSLSLIQKTFQIRQCEDSYFANRSRPCLQYQIKRCTAPCVDYISKEDYAKDVENVKLFYQGKSEQVIKRLQKKMDVASQELDFELAARYRDQIKQMRHVMQQQVISGTASDLDVIGVAYASGVCCILLVFIRQGMIVGNKTYFPKVPKHSDLQEIVSTFLGFYYLSGAEIPKQVVIESLPEDIEALQEAFGEQRGNKVTIRQASRGQVKEWQTFANKNAEHSLRAKLNSKSNFTQRLLDLQKALQMEHMPKHVECFDISHTQGQQTVASCVVFDENGPKKADYRIFNISGITGGDDYAAMQQALTRRYKRLKDEQQALPDLVIVDGGKGQLAKAEEVFNELELKSSYLIGVSKGSDRKVGMEQIWFPGQHQPLLLDDDSKAMHFIQHIRDEAHRFAITKHRHQRKKSATKSLLEEIPGVGAKRRQALLRHFGGWQEVEKASVKDIAGAPGVSMSLAQKIYDYLHS